ncbi:MAG: carboxypeptidase-like regulatory domain-containing protein [Leeuwenhoekiella sp.]
MRLTSIFILFVICLSAKAQTVISGTITNGRQNPIAGANVFIDGSYDGATSAEDGSFTFQTFERGQQLLKITYLSFEPFTFFADVSQMNGLVVKLKDDVNALDAVILNAGTFEAGDNAKVTALKPLDIVTTASALGDFVGALQTLPGTSTVAEDGRLFVRGGDASEAQIFIDGIRVFTPYTPTTNNLPTRGRYSPFLFDGITFSTGGYSAEYGQALSSVLLLNTIDEPDQDETNISLMTVGGGIGHTKKWDKSSLSINTSYLNLAPYFAVFSGRNEWYKPFETFAGESVFRKQTRNGIFKFYTAYDVTDFSLNQEDINAPDSIDFALKNNNLYTNTTYQGTIGETWSVLGGASFTYATNKMDIDDARLNSDEKSAHAKLKFRKRFSNRIKLNLGSEYFFTAFSERFLNNTLDATTTYNGGIGAAFAEADFIFSKKLASKVGVRTEYTSALETLTVSPRLSLALKTGAKSQFSLAYGDFYQDPGSEFLKYTTDLQNQKTSHYILNYLKTGKNTIFRAEVYRKTYSNLVTFDTSMPLPTSTYGNGGSGYAQGVDVFYRNNGGIKNLDYWVSYSFLDTERKYRNFPEQATPTFGQPHNFSLVGKYWMEDWKSQLGFSYQFASGRPYTDRNQPGFLQATAKPFHNLSINCAYLIDQQKILYLSVQNVLGYKNVNGYQYASTPDVSGNFARRSLRPGTDQFFFVGFFWTISADGTKNQLDNL